MSLFKNQTRIAMAYTNKVGDKVYPVVVDIKKGIKSTEDIQFVSSDVNTGILSVAFIQGNDNYNVTGADVVCSVMRPDASTLELPCEVVGENIVEVPLGINGTSQDGIYSFDFKVLKGENKVVGTPIMNYSVSLSIDNDMVVEEDDRLPVLTVLMTQITALKNETNEVISTANTAIQNANKATDDTKLAISNAQSATQEAEDVIARVNNAIASGTQDLEVREARDGEVTLKARLDRDIEKAKQVYVELEGSYISTESSTGAIEDLEILGNTIQDPNNLADIKSVGELQEDGTYKMSILSCGKNLLNSKMELGTISGGLINTSSTNQIRTVDFVRLKPNTDYVISGIPNYTVIFCTKNYEYITEVGRQGGTKFTTPENCEYIKFRTYSSDNITNINTNIQLEEGTVATSYEPYQENKCDILLPCQLEKVGDVSDRLYYDDMEKAWCIEKNIETIIYNGTESWISDGSTELNNKFRVAGYIGDTKSISNLFLNTFWDKYNTASGTEFISTDSSVKTVHVSVLKSKCPTLQSFKEFLGTNNLIIKTIVVQPQFIPLPRDTQIALNSFFGTTHVYMESGEVEGTIKCKIPKSLGATVQSLNNKTDILSDRIEAIEGLKDSQNMKYETDKGYLVCKETKNGVIDDLKIEGKTLVNVLRLGGNWFEQETTLQTDSMANVGLSSYTKSIDISLLKSNTVYTVIPFVDYTVVKKGMLYVQLNTEINGVQNSVFRVNEDTFNKPTRITINELTNKNNCSLFIGGANCEYKFKNVNIIILEGDHTQNPPSYFEGLMSVGQDVDKIEVLSVKSDGNLFDANNYISNTLISIINNGNSLTIKGYGGIYFPFFVRKGVSYKFTGVGDINITNVRLYKSTTGKGEDILAQLGIEELNNTYVAEFTGIIYIRYWLDNKTATVSNIQIEEGTVATPYIPHQSDKKQILFYNSNGELEPIQELHEWDSIEKHSDNKWYYHKRSGKVVLNGSESWLDKGGTTNTKRCQLDVSSWKCKNTNDYGKSIVCDKFRVLDGGHYDSDVEHFYIDFSRNYLYMFPLLSKLPTQDLQGFKQWLQANNVTVVYQLAQEEVYELAPLHLDSYANETLILCNSGAISPKMEFSITSHINELVKSQGDRISLLEEKMYKALKQVLAGDMYSLAELLYPEDFVEENPENEIMLL